MAIYDSIKRKPIGFSNGMNFALCTSVFLFLIVNVLFTQRPDKASIALQIEANMGAGIAFGVSNASNARVIIDQNRAVYLTQKGRCLFKKGKELIEIQPPLLGS